MSTILIIEIIYLLIVVGVCLRVIYDTQSVNKSISYLLVVIFLPALGILIYFTFGINYRHRQMYSKNLIDTVKLQQQYREQSVKESPEIIQSTETRRADHKARPTRLLHEDYRPSTRQNKAEILINGEERCPRVKEELRKARHHSHLEYYIYEPDTIGQEIADILMEKAREGVEVRLIYDDFGSRNIRRNLVPQLRKAGVEVHPFYKIKIVALANKINYRNHRKIIVIDGQKAFVGGINISNHYINDSAYPTPIYWRDIHLYMSGPVVRSLQFLFMGDWNFCARDNLQPSREYFPRAKAQPDGDDLFMQIAASGPDSDSPVILYSILQAIMLAKQEILITTPYFVPGESLKDLVIVAAKGGITVRLMVPEDSDSRFVNLASQSYYMELLRAGVKIYRYKKGLVHSKTMMIDQEIVIIGTANMDIRSFDLNFEVNAVIYNEEKAAEMRQIFFEDVRDSQLIRIEEWQKRSRWIFFAEKIARLMSPLL